jgi:putative Holliday junction resolvase
MEYNSITSINCIGIDFGLRHCGIAIGQTLTRNARPLTIIKAINGAIAMYQLEAIIHTYQIKTIVIGSICDHTLAKILLSFSQLLRHRHPNLKIYFVEEMGTSKEARILVKSRRQRDDAIAASLILENWFNEISR